MVSSAARRRGAQQPVVRESKYGRVLLAARNSGAFDLI